MDNRKRTSIPGLAPLAALSLSLATTLPASAQPAPAAPPPSSTAAAPLPPPPAPPSTTSAAPLPPPPPAPTTEGAESTEEQPKPKKRKKQPRLSNETWDSPSPQQPPPMWAPMDDPSLPVLPRRIEYEEGDILLPGYQLKVQPTRSLLIGGIVTFAVPYGLSALVGGAYAFDDNERDSELFGPLLVPVFGPFISLGIENSRAQEFPNARSTDDDLYAFFMLLNGFTQLTGAAMIAAGILVPEKYLERAQALPGKPELLVGGSSAAVRFHF
ncbi:hypothetical protein [Polyangium jinanense]|uniref:Uncharacterized protein n=1 Tax=Polyangium jinanense TaxID=2829994 RepID=A0A9X3XAE8_9BACT|nr:hypothetical protein [Polyangium jinanense]MDC3985363.1 hypothetical protein [Polyangium jinanense]